jgi:membrane associated rhomboid family serine protease
MFLVFFVVPMPAFLFAIVYIALSAWAASAGRQDGVGHAAHLGGALAGIAIVCIGWPDAPRQMIDQIMAALV